jgi:pimeloyl-ACP methyl ester carboxylesterase
MAQVLIPGGTYNSRYWDFPYQPDNYSYVHAMTAKGYTTFNVDRIGTGRSARIPSLLDDLYTNAFTFHELVQQLRAGHIGGRSFTRVVLVSHSMGTLIGMIEASRFHDVDGFVATGMVHKVSPTVAPALLKLLYPAVLEPRFRDHDLGYTTTIPGLRSGSPMYSGNVDPEVVRTDEAVAKDVIARQVIAEFPVVLFDGTTNGVTAPTLVVEGAQDAVFCAPFGSDCSSSDALRRQEAVFYPHAPLSAYVLPDSGHDINLHRTAKSWFDAAANWLQSTLGGP